MLACTLGLLVLAGCGSKDKLIGSWSGDMTISLGNQSYNLSGTADFNEDGSFSARVKPAQVSAIFSWDGTWKREGDVLTITPSKADLDLSKAPILDALLGDQKAKAEADLMAPLTARLEWRGDDEAVFRPDNGPVVNLRRSK